MICKVGTYKLDVDVERTGGFYEAVGPALDCDCAGCRNYEKAIAALPEPICQFLRQFGLQPEKPIEVAVCYAPDKQQIVYNVFFHICGQILEEVDPWLPAWPKKSKPNMERLVRVTEECGAHLDSDCVMLDGDFPRPAIQLDITFNLPWVLDEENPYMWPEDEHVSE